LRIAFFSPPFFSHLDVMGAIAGELSRLGHECVLVGHPRLADKLPKGLQLAALDESACAWTPESVVTHARSPDLVFGIRRTIRDMAAMTHDLCRQAPAMLRALQVDGIVCDQMEAAGSLVAEHLRLPFVAVAAAVPINREPLVPLPVLPFSFDQGEQALHRNRIAARIADWMTAAHHNVIAQEAERLGCTRKQTLSDCLSPLAQISQLTAGLDLPRQALPPSFHYVGPLRTGPAPAQGATLPPLDSKRPFVFASLGTLQGHRLGLWHKIAKACRRLHLQLLVAHCGGLTDAQAATIDADFVVDRVSQSEAMQRADLVITHGGVNTVLDAITAKVPMLCIPLAFDQPGMAARVKRCGVGEGVPARAGSRRIETALRALLQNKSAFQAAMQPLAEEMRTGGGAARAAAIIEAAITTRAPVIRATERLAA
jgi:zeaxanthin glucosyltransferase